MLSRGYTIKRKASRLRKCMKQPELDRRMRGNVLVRCGEGLKETYY